MTLCTGERGKILMDKWGYTHKAYAQSIGVDHVIYAGSPTNKLPMLDKYAINDLLKVYKRVIYLDADIEVLPGAANLLKIVPKNKIGLVDEAILWAKYGRGCTMFARKRIRSVGFHNGYMEGYEVETPRFYYNSGMLVVSRRHRFLFELPSKAFEYEHCYDQDLLSARIQWNGIKPYLLKEPIQWMAGFGVDPTPEQKFRHYAGVHPY
jgi:hypothetical protein